MHTYLVCFDISNDEQRRKVGILLATYGIRVQRSVFEIALDSTTQLHTLKRDLQPYLATEDDLRFYHLCVHCRQNSFDMNNQRLAQFPTWVVV